MDSRGILQEIVEAHGGLALWNDLSAIEAEVSARGLLFTMKRRPGLKHVRVTAKTKGPHFFFHGFPSPGLTGELIGNDEVRISTSEGNIAARRYEPRGAFKGLRRLLYWDDLDFIYFGGYATWNYLVVPFLFLYEGFHFEPVEPPRGLPPSWVGLRVTFPEQIPTHCSVQTFYFDENRHLRRLDYTAEVVGRWAHAAHFCEDYRDFNGFKAPTRRTVRPLVWGGMTLPGPTLVAIEIHGIRLLRVP